MMPCTLSSLFAAKICSIDDAVGQVLLYVTNGMIMWSRQCAWCHKAAHLRFYIGGAHLAQLEVDTVLSARARL